MPASTNVTNLPRLWLASQSPRRAQLLTTLGLSFKTAPTHVEEAELVDGSVEATVLENAMRKAKLACSKVPEDTDIVIAADTLVALENQILSKPSTREEAIAGLQNLSGKTHRVLTGLVVMSRKNGERKTVVESRVRFRNLNLDEITQYVDTGEPFDKAGGYGIQGLASLFVENVEGSYPNVMGLPVETLLKELSILAGVAPHAWFQK